MIGVRETLSDFRYNPARRCATIVAAAAKDCVVADVAKNRLASERYVCCAPAFLLLAGKRRQAKLLAFYH